MNRMVADRLPVRQAISMTADTGGRPGGQLVPVADSGARPSAGRAVHQVGLPPGARAFCTLAHLDYHDAFLAGIGEHADRTAGEWARAMLTDAPAATRRSLARGWSALGLRLEPAGSAESVLGWGIRRSTPDLALLGVSGRRGLSGELLFLRQPDSLLFATFVQLDNPLARGLWAAIAARHRQVVQDLLERATRKS
jgi:hypothetical protein